MIKEDCVLGLQQSSPNVCFGVLGVMNVLFGVSNGLPVDTIGVDGIFSSQWFASICFLLISVMSLLPKRWTGESCSSSNVGCSPYDFSFVDFFWKPGGQYLESSEEYWKFLEWILWEVRTSSQLTAVQQYFWSDRRTECFEIGPVSMEWPFNLMIDVGTWNNATGCRDRVQGLLSVELTVGRKRVSGTTFPFG